MKFRTHIMHFANGNIISDNSRGAWELLIGKLWLARFGEDWRHRYGSTWAVSWGRRIWIYTPAERDNG